MAVPASVTVGVETVVPLAGEVIVTAGGWRVSWAVTPELVTSASE